MTIKKIIDISWPITNDITTYKNKKIVAIAPLKTFEVDHVRESIITLWSHTGTHVDAPAHFVETGANIEQVDLQLINGRCKILDFSYVEEKIMTSDLEQHEILENDIILLKTKNSASLATAPDTQTFVYLDGAAAAYLVKRRVKSVGIDHLGIERKQPAHETHQALLGAGIPIIEGLRLASVTAGTYFLSCLPLAVVGIEAAPVRAVLLVF